MKYSEILPTHAETPRNTTRKIANLYIEFNYHFLTLQKKIPLLLNRSVQINPFQSYNTETQRWLIYRYWGGGIFFNKTLCVIFDVIVYLNFHISIVWFHQKWIIDTWLHNLMNWLE